MIRQATSEDLDLVRDLFREYAAWVGAEICVEAFESEVAALPGHYAQPEGRLLVAFPAAGMAGYLAGCVALRPLEPGIAEVKRLYVRPAFQGSGLGRKLTERMIAEARSAGYKRLRLDSLQRMEAAIALYRSLGFYQIPSYSHHPGTALCFELALTPHCVPRASSSAEVTAKSPIEPKCY